MISKKKKKCGENNNNKKKRKRTIELTAVYITLYSKI